MIVDGKSISYSYDYSETSFVLKNIDISIEKGDFVTILGCNGSGKSTLVKHFNGLLALQHGELNVAQIDVRNEKDLWRLRRICGMVFQNPDNQFVSSIVNEDISFGLENYEVPRNEIQGKVSSALELVDMKGYEKRKTNTLSGGQKQRVALAGVLALDPDIIIFDEATAMLDPSGRQEVINIMDRLQRAGKTIIAITHYVEEAVAADKVILMDKGRILSSGKPKEILTNTKLMNEAGMMVPMTVRIYYDLLEAGIRLSNCPLTDEELVEEICQLR